MCIRDRGCVSLSSCQKPSNFRGLFFALNSIFISYTFHIEHLWCSCIQNKKSGGIKNHELYEESISICFTQKRKEYFAFFHPFNSVNFCSNGTKYWKCVKTSSKKFKTKYRRFFQYWCQLLRIKSILSRRRKREWR